jgi:hypothetical protein
MAEPMPQTRTQALLAAVKDWHARLNLRRLTEGLVPTPPPARPSVNQDETQQLRQVDP